MNFIESLGGYENAKERCKRENVLTDEDFKYGQDQLLKYRREHGIFEVGDWVVKTNPKIRYAHVRVVISTSISGGAALDYQGFPYRYPCIRHATDEEIKAGHRL